MAEGATNGGVARWQVWIGGATLAVIIFGSLLTLYYTVNVAFATANDDKQRLDRMTVQLNTTQEKLVVVCSALVEVETQLRATEQVRNLMHANDQRLDSMLWSKVYKQEYPLENSYYPSIAQDKVSPCA